MKELVWLDIKQLPCFAIGYRVSYDIISIARHNKNLPPWIYLLTHQTGGYSCGCVYIICGIMELRNNKKYLRGNPDIIIDAFRSIGEMGQNVARYDYSQFKLITKTHGENLSPHALSIVEDILKRHIDIPRVLGGVEGMLEIDSGECLGKYVGWSLTIPQEKAISQEGQNKKAAIRRIKYNDEILKIISEAAKTMGIDDSPRLFLLWENSD